MNVLFLPSNAAHVKTFIPIADELARRSHTPLFLHRDRRIHKEFRVAALLDHAKYDVLEYDGYYHSDLPYILPPPLRYLRFRQALRKFLKTIHFDVLVVANDFSAMFERLALHEAHRAGKATLLIQESVRPSHRSLPRLVQLREVGPKALLGEMLMDLARRLRLGPYFRKGYGFSGCTRIAAAGDSFRRHLVERGVDAERISVTGQPRLDARQPERPERRTPRTDAGRPAVLLFCSQPLHCRQRTLDRFFTELVRACCSIQNTHLILKLHPRDLPPEHWKSLIPHSLLDDTVTVTQHTPLGECLASADALMTIASTTALEGMVVGLPVALVNFLPTSWYLPYADLNAVLPITHESELRQTLQTLLFDTEARRRCVARADSVLHDELYLRDGESALRIADVIEVLASDNWRSE